MHISIQVVLIKNELFVIDRAVQTEKLWHLVLNEQEGKQHEEASVVNYPPHVDGPSLQTFLVAGEMVNVLCNKQSLMGFGRLSYSFCGGNS